MLQWTFVFLSINAIYKIIRSFNSCTNCINKKYYKITDQPIKHCILILTCMLKLKVRISCLKHFVTNNFMLIINCQLQNFWIFRSTQKYFYSSQRFLLCMFIPSVFNWVYSLSWACVISFIPFNSIFSVNRLINFIHRNLLVLIKL